MLICKGCNTDQISSEDELCESCSDFCNERINEICEGEHGNEIKYIYRNGSKTTIGCDIHHRIISKTHVKQDIYYGDEQCVYCEVLADLDNLYSLEYLTEIGNTNEV